MGTCSGKLVNRDSATGAVILNPNMFQFGEMINTGGFGIVYRAYRKKDGKEFAMKFFGYTDSIPLAEDIDVEIGLLESLNHLNGVLHLEGIFTDTVGGIVSTPSMPKITFEPFKVIVMEVANGGDVFDRIRLKGSKITESYIAKSFHTAFIALKEIHDARYLHRDLKVENMIAISDDDNSAIKLIDFGMMVKVPEGEDKLIDPQKPGTPSYIAPESYALGVYSYKSDVWQAGLSLYCTVCAEYAFDNLPPSRGPLHRWQFKQDSAFKLLSKSVQDLLFKMIHPVERERITLEEALSHPWFHGEAPNVLLGDAYEKKIAKLKLRKNLKNFFMSKDITIEAAERAVAFKKNLSSASTPRGVSPFKGVPVESLNKLKNVVYQGLLEKVRRSSSCNIDEDERETPLLNRTNTDLIRDGEVDYEGFCDLMRSVDLSAMANRNIFKIFDINNDGCIALKEFLFTLVSFRRANDPFPDAARLFFDMFDVDGDGHISRTELQAVTQCLLEDGMTDSFTALAKDIESLYDTIHSRDEESVDFAEFKVFYERIIRRSLAPSRSSLASPVVRGHVNTPSFVHDDLLSIPESLTDADADAEAPPPPPVEPPRLKLPANIASLKISV